MNPIRLAVLLSGGGTTLQNLIDRIADGRLPAQIVQVISDQPDAFGLTRARAVNLPAMVISRKECGSRAEFGRRIFDTIRESGADLVCLAGFLQLLPIPDDFRGRVMNIHPALLPSFPGLHAQRQALAYGVKLSGVTVHFVDEGLDSGPIIAQAAIGVEPDDTEETLARKILKEEHRLYPEAIGLFFNNRLRIEGRTVHITGR